MKSQGFWLVANTCDWTNIDGDDAGVYSIDGYWGEVKAWRVEINRRVVELSDKRELDPKDVLADLLGEELPLDDPEKVAQMIIERLADAGFVIWPHELPKPPKAP